MPPRHRIRIFGATLVLAVGLGSFAHAAESTLLNVSYDVSRELYKDINPAFVAHWKAKTGGGEAAAREFIAKLFANVPVLDGGIYNQIIVKK